MRNILDSAGQLGCIKFHSEWYLSANGWISNP